jgi:hypothetical protein
MLRYAILLYPLTPYITPTGIWRFSYGAAHNRWRRGAHTPRPPTSIESRLTRALLIFHAHFPNEHLLKQWCGELVASPPPSALSDSKTRKFATRAIQPRLPCPPTRCLRAAPSFQQNRRTPAQIGVRGARSEPAIFLQPPFRIPKSINIYAVLWKPFDLDSPAITLTPLAPQP